MSKKKAVEWKVGDRVSIPAPWALDAGERTTFDRAEGEIVAVYTRGLGVKVGEKTYLSKRKEVWRCGALGFHPTSPPREAQAIHGDNCL